jgi:hypothetical protein
MYAVVTLLLLASSSTYFYWNVYYCCIPFCRNMYYCNQIRVIQFLILVIQFRISPAIWATPFKMATSWFGERFDIDTIGPLPKDDYENEYVVVIVDAFAGLVKLTSVKSTRIIHWDRATQFLNDMVTSLITEGFSAFQRSAEEWRRLHRKRRTRSSNERVRKWIATWGHCVRHCFLRTMVVWFTDDTTYH